MGNFPRDLHFPRRALTSETWLGDKLGINIAEITTFLKIKRALLFDPRGVFTKVCTEIILPKWKRIVRILSHL